MFLKQLNLYGFKSFAEKTELEFVPGVTAVVGPNGSGKSNVTDALRWVLGEQSAKSLRGGTMEDVIFAGSDTRKALNYAEVVIILDNQEGKLPIDYNEVSVKRRVFRTGESEFFINDNPCRLRDIVDLFTDSGLGREAFSIISQGKVDQILNSKPEERRTIFEEAAGVLKYKRRKKKTEEKLAETEENLNRVQDILHELDGQLVILKEQAETAEQFLAKQKELKQIEGSLIVREIESLYAKWEKVKGELETQTDSEIMLSNEIRKLEMATDDERKSQNELDEKVNRLQEELLSVSEHLEKLEGRRQVLQEKSRNAIRNMEVLKDKIKSEHEKNNELLLEKNKTEQIISHKQAEADELNKQLSGKKRELTLLDGTLDQTIESLKSDYVDFMNEHVSDKNELQYIEKQLDQQNIRLQRLATDKAKYEKEKISVEKKIEGKQKKLRELKDQISSFENEQQHILKEMDSLKEQREYQQSRLFQLYRNNQQMKARKESLETMEEDFTGYMQGVREVLKAKGALLQGIEGSAADLINVPKDLETGIETALGGAVQHVVVQTEADGREAINYLKKNRLGRATFLPLNVIKPKYLSTSQKTGLQRHSSFLGVAADLVGCEKKYEPVIRYLLGNVIVAKDLKGAGELAKLVEYRLRIVTLAGEIINPGGSMTGGASKQKRSSLLGRKNQLEHIKKELAVLERDISSTEITVNTIKQKMTDFESQVSHGQAEKKKLESMLYELQSEVARLDIALKNTQEFLSLSDMETKELATEGEALQLRKEKMAAAIKNKGQSILLLEEKIKDLTEEKSSQQSSKDQILTAINQLSIQTAQLEEQLVAAKSNLKRIDASIEQTGLQAESAEKELKDLEDENENILGQVAELQKETEKTQTMREETLQNISISRNERARLQESVTDKEVELKELTRQQKRSADKLKNEELKVNRLELEMENLIKTLRDEFTISFERAQKVFSLSLETPEAEQRRDALKRQISEIGTVNIGAIEEYERVNSRSQFLLEQQTDLTQAKETLYQIMDEMDDEMKKRFGSTFQSIQEAFQGVFSSLFGGGRAELKLTEPDDLLQTGVDIIAQPPGKKLQNLSLLSGGERSFTAIALLFSILKVRPVPFCVLDEVEAALDEANVNRFSEYLKKFSEHTQFIVITHRQGTMAGADVLYGITMQESGVSKLVSVKLEEERMMAQI
ncbi:chromosome segregation protein SMC [Bacillus norwichensis]|uniref:Chromosome partition protein Smc n=1 Tax=Bacillus norwichensis TaxID=2762217 RepID=A0ABR8VGT7_9BACI|nr:chromosome segregation protein SMC [Bacillus norwichensis]MBD8003989.1 chromosome segregation protein SMC [Bacillus norwichensis]